MRIYLDNCCFNRPFDNQSDVRIRIESEAKLHVQELIIEGRLELVWSYILDHENGATPFHDRRECISSWAVRAGRRIEASPNVPEKAESYASFGIKAVDALHVACAVTAGCAVFLKTDRGILRRREQLHDLDVMDLPTFVRERLS